MKKYFKEVFPLALIVFLVAILLATSGKEALAPISSEIRRYSGVNPWYFAVAGGVIVWSYLMGWVYSKIAQTDR